MRPARNSLLILLCRLVLGVLGFQVLAMFALSGGVRGLDAAVILATAVLLLRGKPEQGGRRR